MADNYLEKHYADYEARKHAYRQGGARKAMRRAMWQVATIVLPSNNDVAMQRFYVELFGGEVVDGGVVFDNGLQLDFVPKRGNSVVKIIIAMASQYQREQMFRRLAEANVDIDSEGVVCDPSGNEVVIRS